LVSIYFSIIITG